MCVYGRWKCLFEHMIYGRERDPNQNSTIKTTETGKSIRLCLVCLKRVVKWSKNAAAATVLVSNYGTQHFYFSFFEFWKVGGNGLACTKPSNLLPASITISTVYLKIFLDSSHFFNKDFQENIIDEREREREK